MNKKRILVLTVLTFVFLLVSVAFQDPIEGARKSSKRSLEARKRANAAQLQRIHRELKRIRNAKVDMVQQVRKVDMELNSATQELNNIIREEKIIVTQHQRLAAELEIAKGNFRSYRDKYRGRLVVYYKNGSVRYIEILFSSWNFTDFVNRVHMLRLLATRDLDIMRNLQVKRDEVDAKKREVALKREEVRINKEEQVVEKKQIEQIHHVKQKQLSEILEDEAALVRQEQALMVENARIERELAAMIAAAMRSSGRNLAPRFTGSLGNPICDGSWRLTSNFGPRRRPRAGASSYHKGIDLGIHYGQKICAAASGTVIYAGWKGGYGNAVIVAHSQDFATLYAHGKGFPPGIRTGATVSKGQVVLYGDSSGVSTGNHLHFSVFKNNVSVNPMNYF